MAIVFSLFILINLPVADSYSLAQSNPSIKTQKIEDEKKSGKLSLSQIFSLNIFPMISADGGICCDTNTCNTIVDDDGSCDAFPSTSCDYVPECGRLGCCIDSGHGSAYENTPQALCINGEWIDDPSCSIPEDLRGCCVIGDGNVAYENEAQCGRRSENLGIEMDFRDVNNEAECLALAVDTNEGACIKDIGNTQICQRTTGTRCLEEDGNFIGGYLCSNEAIANSGISCEKQDHVGCSSNPNQDGIYWFDGCGNQENVYVGDREAERDESWSNGRINYDVTCSLDSTDCGACSIYDGNKCAIAHSNENSVDAGNYVCRNLGCEFDGKHYDHGESWCIYESSFGQRSSPYYPNTNISSDPVGSEQAIATCQYGEVKVNIAGDGFRTGVCLQGEIEQQDSNGIVVDTFKTATEAPNPADKCVTITLDHYDNLDGVTDQNKIDDEMTALREDCEAVDLCVVKTTDFGDGFKFDMCVPEVPKGANLTNSEQQSLCALANLPCTFIEEYASSGGGLKWKAKYNNACVYPEYSQKMNDLCVSLGDCGSYINYLGEGTDNTLISRRGGFKTNNMLNIFHQNQRALDNPSEDYGLYTNPLENKFLPLTLNLEQVADVLGGSGIPTTSNNPDYGGVGWDNTNRLLNWAATVPGAIGSTLIAMGNWGLYTYYTYEAGAPVSASLGVFGQSSLGVISGTILYSLGWAALGATIGMFVGAWAADRLGRSGEGANVIIIGLSIATAIITVLLVVGASNFWNPIGWASAIAAAAAAAFSAATGWGDTHKVKIKFECLPWQAPTGEQNCEACSDGSSLIPCDAYRCQSIGQTCKFINANTDHPSCISEERENVAPIITRTDDVTDGYTFTEPEQGGTTRIETLNGGCIEPNQRVRFVLNTDEVAQCKYDFVGRTTTYEEMENNYPIHSNDFELDHTFEILMPGLDQIPQEDIETGEYLSDFGNAKMFIRCNDIWGNFNPTQYAVEFCINDQPDTQPVDQSLTQTIPEDGSYIPYSEDSSSFKMYLNEPAQCRYSYTPDVSYDNMINEMTCFNDVANGDERETFYLNGIVYDGWLCSTTLNDLTQTENKIYFRCKDQPWIDTTEGSSYTGDRTEEDQNVNVNDFVFTIHKSRAELSIDSLSIDLFDAGENPPIIGTDNIIQPGYVPINVELNVKTSGGMNGDGTAICSWGVLEGGSRTPMWETNSNTHSQPLTNKMDGIHNVYVDCVDEVGNEATGEVSFVIDADSQAPNVVRAYKDSGKLKIVTNEDSVCYYNNIDDIGCSFDVDGDHSEQMGGGISTEHTTDWNAGQTYYIKCKDLWNNIQNGCGIIVRPTDF